MTTIDVAPTRWISTAELAAQMGVHEATARRWARDGLFGARKTGPRMWRFPAGALEPQEGD